MHIFDFEFVVSLIPIMIKYLGVTLKMSLLALVLGIVVAMIIAFIVDADIPVLKGLSKIYI